MEMKLIYLVGTVLDMLIPAEIV